MSKYKVGDEFIVKIKEVIDSYNGTLYRSNFSTLVFDDYGLDNLDNVATSANIAVDKAKAYQKGLNDAWELVRKLYCDIEAHELREIFDYKSNHHVDASIVFGWTLNELTPQQALAKIEAYEESKAIKVGDVVYAQGIKGVVIDDCTEDSDDTCYVFCENGNIEDWKFVDLKKTGRHIDISNLLEQIRGDD